MRDHPGDSRDRLLAGLLVCLLVAPLACRKSESGAAGNAPAKASAAVPGQVRVVDLEGLRAELEARRTAGRPVLLNFWATWCRPCVQEMPELTSLAQQWGASGPEVIGVSLDGWVIADEAELQSVVETMVKEMGLVYPNVIYRGEQDPLMNAFKMPGPIPFSILYGGDGKVAATWAGSIDVEELRTKAASLKAHA